MPGLAGVDTSGSIAVLGLNQDGFEKSFETRKQKGYVAAYQVAQAKGKQPARLYMATVEENALSGRPFSTIFTYFWKNRK